MTEHPAFPMKRIDPLEPPPSYRQFRESAPVSRARLWNGDTVWLVSRFEDARAVLGDSATFSTVPTRTGYPMMAAGRAEFLLNERPTFIRMDPPEHTSLRRMLTREFSVSKIEAMRGDLLKMVDDLLDAMQHSGPPADLVTALALPLPTMVISRLLGIPYEDHEFFQERTSTKLDLSKPPEVTLRAQNDIIEYLDKLLAAKAAAADPGDDILGMLVTEQVKQGHLSHEDAVAMAEMLIVAGHETTANMIALGTILLLRHPEQLEALHADRGLMPGAVEEMLRYLTITHFNGARVATRDTEVAGQPIREGEGVWALLPSANRDDSAFPDADRFDITRKARHHMTFGFGVHQCLGQGLARLELDLVFNRMLDRFPNLGLAVPEAEIDYKFDAFVFGVRSLPVTW